MTEWGRVAIRVDQAHEALGHRSFEVDGGVFVRNPELPDIHVANYGHSVTARFPAEIDGQDALLCWHVGEPRIAYWHSPEDGFAGRKPLE